VEVDASVQEAGDRRLVDGEEGATVRGGGGGFLGALVAALAADRDNLDLRGDVQLLDLLLEHRKDHMGVAAGLPGHDQFRRLAGYVRCSGGDGTRDRQRGGLQG
jgi:hypothetical protein